MRWMWSGCLSAFTKQIQINKIRVPGICGERLIRRIAISGWRNRKYLPYFLTSFCEKVYETESLFPHRSDTIWGRKAGQMHQNTALTHTICSPLNKKSYKPPAIWCAKRRIPIICYRIIITVQSLQCKDFLMRSLGKRRSPSAIPYFVSSVFFIEEKENAFATR